MIFNIYEDYNDGFEYITQEQYNVCFICFEYNNNFENNPTSLHKQQLYFSNCNCNVAVHNNCLQIWVDKNKSCPICRNIIIVKNNNISIISQFLPWGIQIYSVSKKIYIFILRILLFVLINQVLFDFYFQMIILILILFKFPPMYHN